MSLDYVLWDQDIHAEDELWVCSHCDAHLHCDSVGDNCPVCGEKADDW